MVSDALRLDISCRSRFLIDLDADELKYATTKHLSAYAPRVGYAAANLRSQEEIRTAVAKAAKFFDSRIDALVNNAGTVARSMKPSIMQYLTA